MKPEYVFMLLGGLGLFLCGMQMMSSNPWSTCRSRHHSSHPVVIRYYRDGRGLC